ncbi:hypothetical protein ACTFIZ_007527 [Dictyostelium cf. discoideum]
MNTTHKTSSMIPFTKMQGAGNDFIVLNGIDHQFNFTADEWRLLADRHFGIGADQILIVEKTSRVDADFKYRIFNADGNEVEHCEIMPGIIVLTITDDGQVTVDMGVPIFNAPDIPFIADHLEHKKIDNYPAAIIGPQIEAHPNFPKRVNAGFVQIIDMHTIMLRVYERGSGETLACGTGACAAAVAGINQNLLDSPFTINTHGGVLTISWNKKEENARGEVDLNELKKSN